MTISFANEVLEQVPITSTQAYLCPTVTDALLASAVVSNSSTATATLTVNIVVSGDSADSTNEYISKKIAAGTSVVLYEIINVGLNTGDSIYATAGVASALNLKIRVKETTT